MRSLFAAAVVATVTMAESMHPREFDFMRWISKWNKTYHTREEYVARLNNWLKTDEVIREINAPDSEHTHTAAHNKFSDFTREEYKKMLNKMPVLEDNEPTLDAPEGYVPNKEINWATGNCVTAVKNQEQCGSCWAFSTVEEIESCWFLAGNPLPVLSPQQIVSCDNGEQGCNGGDTVQAYSYVEQAGGLDSAAAYPYTSGGGDSGQCHFKKNNM